MGEGIQIRFKSQKPAEQLKFVTYGLTKRSAVRARAEPDGTRAETTFRLSPKRTSPFKSAGESVQSTAGSRGVRVSGSNVGYTTFRGSLKSTGYPFHSPVSPSLPLPCVTVCQQIPNAVYQNPTSQHSQHGRTPFNFSIHLPSPSVLFR